MRESPALPGPAAAIGPLASAPEDELADAYPELRRSALPMTWAAVALGIDVARLKVLARRGRLLAIPGPWSMRQAYPSGICYLLPAWQFAAGARTIEPEVSPVIEAAAAAGWTDLELHRYMTAPGGARGTTPAETLHADGAETVAALIHGDIAAPPEATPRRHLRLPRFEPFTARRHHAARGAARADARGGSRGRRSPARARAGTGRRSR
jgi:hypothetical protein